MDLNKIIRADALFSLMQHTSGKDTLTNQPVIK